MYYFKETVAWKQRQIWKWQKQQANDFTNYYKGMVLVF